MATATSAPTRTAASAKAGYTPESWRSIQQAPSAALMGQYHQALSSADDRLWREKESEKERSFTLSRDEQQFQRNQQETAAERAWREQQEKQSQQFTLTRDQSEKQFTSQRDAEQRQWEIDRVAKEQDAKLKANTNLVGSMRPMPSYEQWAAERSRTGAMDPRTGQYVMNAKPGQSTGTGSYQQANSSRAAYDAYARQMQDVNQMQAARMTLGGGR